MNVRLGCFGEGSQYKLCLGHRVMPESSVLLTFVQVLHHAAIESEMRRAQLEGKLPMKTALLTADVRSFRCFSKPTSLVLRS